MLSSVIALHRIACRVAGHWPCHTRPDWSRLRAGEEGDLKDFRVKHRLSAFGIRLTAGHVVYALKRQMTRRANDSGQMNEPSIFNHSIGYETVFYCISRNQRRRETNGCNQCCKLRSAFRTRTKKKEQKRKSEFIRVYKFGSVVQDCIGKLKSLAFGMNPHSFLLQFPRVRNIVSNFKHLLSQCKCIFNFVVLVA